ncbi:SAM-dependent methyltransferase, MidA family [Hydrogenimonas thermophila]|uniref:SAM-dependent methyltransferase, MidA family n=2 Tax=Hydrogenimonas thermophila TaxID=223786 RepID=A0A1I5U590_9BACT|nr:SAM-dependent methyltransferase, MidA family [Hydrogenimonas thermophila]
MKRFSEYMNEWLYGKEGYYSTFKSIGREGDFYTAVSTSRFFGATISHYMISLIKSGKLNQDLHLIEIGAHQGYLLADMIEWIAQEAPELLDTMKFGIIERFDSLKEAQQNYFKNRFGDAIELNHYSDPSEVNAKEAFIVANEIFDAFACDLIYKQKIALVDEETHTIHFEGEDEEVFEIANRYGQTKGEVAKGYESFASSLYKAAQKIVFATFDYGEKEPRTDFSIRIYKGHEVYPLFEEGLDLKSLFGKSDITYDVNFSHLIDAFEENGFSTYAYKTQLRALTEYGLPELLEQLAKLGNQTLYLRELNKIKTLIDPTIMGERFKLVEFHKNIS